MHELKQRHDWYAKEQISGFIASLGPFFQKYIERGLSRIDAELSSVKANNWSRTGGSTSAQGTFTVQEYKERLASLKSQMFGDQASGGTSPVRNRLESPAAKFARHGPGPNSPCVKKTHDVVSAGGVEVDENVDEIVSLRERLARLKNTG